MRSMVDIDVILDSDYLDPKVIIKTRDRTNQVENIIYAVENASENDFPLLPVHLNDKLEFVSQRDVIRAYSQNRKVMIQTRDNIYMVRKSLTSLEKDLNSERFIRISQSEIINLYKVKQFDITMAGTIGIEFDDGTQSWASRSRVKAIKDMLKGKKRGGR